MDNPQNYYTLGQQKIRDQLETVLTKIGTGLDTLHKDQQRIASATETQANMLNSQVWPTVCAPVMFLALGVDVDASFNLRSHVGRFLVASVGSEGFLNDDPKEPQPGLQQLASPQAGGKVKPKAIGRAAFVRACLAMQQRATEGGLDFCIPATITDEDFGRFYDCAPDLLALANSSAACVNRPIDPNADHLA